MNSAPSPELLRAAGGRRPIRVILDSTLSGTRKQFEFSQPFVLIGRSEQADLRLEHPDVSGRQLYIQLVHGRLFGVHLSNRVPTLWGNEARASGWLDGRKAINIGPYSLRFPAASHLRRRNSTPTYPLAVGSYRGPAIKLQLENRSSAPEVTLDRMITLVGNAPVCKLRLNRSRVSKVHCSLVRTRGGLLVVDLGSREGVRVNGVATRAAILSRGDVLDIGGRCLRVSFK